MLTYTVLSLDVWGNEEDGFEVNDRCRVGTIDLDESLNSDDVLRELDGAGYVHASLCEVNDAIGDEYTLHIDSAQNGRPLLQLELQEEVES